ncbi:hypothetical protein [Rummeliibacillus stabekisii]|uniref:hypothetical protein n=1 Tax=Rummeliibacillus stabekisii TaxID=241244 RepID=UPI0011689459|nr:hypothetical protein [Rummeliibacillus stabekisii]MBB5171583.1 hypothetical protein [Rummeliibacillus stabekisii]GEL05551.1 hypothetical protein RST01_21780 [Rummeliibacillus stabekisii]
MIEQQKQAEMIQQKLSTRVDGTFSIWDHPNFTAKLKLPDDYRPLTSLVEALEVMNRLSKETAQDRLMVLKVVGDAICANENQLRRYLSSKLSYSQTSAYLTAMRKYGFIDRHQCRLSFSEEDGEQTIKPPAPHTLGIAGFLLLSHYYSGDYFAKPESWFGNSYAIQRYVALNEIRCRAVEAKIAKGWSWMPRIGGKSKYRKPTAVLNIASSSGAVVDMLIFRAQLVQDFIGYFKTLLEEYRYLYDRDGRFIIDKQSQTNYQIVVLSVSTLNMAKYIAEEIKLESFDFDIWFLVDELFDKSEGNFAKAFVQKENGDLRILELEF